MTCAGEVREDMCGFEEITQAPDPIETRPRRGDVVNVTYPYSPESGQLNTLERIILGGKEVVRVGSNLHWEDHTGR